MEAPHVELIVTENLSAGTAACSGHVGRSVVWQSLHVCATPAFGPLTPWLACTCLPGSPHPRLDANDNEVVHDELSEVIRKGYELQCIHSEEFTSMFWV